MPTQRREQLRREYVASVCETLKQYVLDGHQFQMRTEHENGDSRVTFHVTGWETFISMLEESAAASDGTRRC